MAPVSPGGALRAADAWVFDLDDTLYPHASGMGEQIRAGIRDFLTRYFRVGPADAAAIQRDLVTRHGSTLRGLHREYGVAAPEFLAFEDRLDYAVLVPDPGLAAALGAVTGRRLVFTNGSRAHARRVLERVGLAGAFEDVYGILEGDLVPKPRPEAYRAFLRHTGIDPARAVMFEDRADNLVPPRSLGMATVLVGESDAQGRADFATDDLAGFLRQSLRQ